MSEPVIRFQTMSDGEHILWHCPKCGAGNTGILADVEVGGWENPRWVLTGTREAPTLRPSLGCWFCYPAGHFWCNDGVLTDA